MTVVLYVRVSTSDQNCELQSRELHTFAQHRGWTVIETYRDTMTAAKGNRPALKSLLADARAKKFDAVLVWKLDRFGRSLIDLMSNIQVLEHSGIRFIATTQGLDTDQRNSTSRFMLHVLGAAA